MISPVNSPLTIYPNGSIKPKIIPMIKSPWFSSVISVIWTISNLFNSFRRTVSYDDGFDMAKKNGMLFMETSAKSAQNIDSLFITLTETI